MEDLTDFYKIVEEGIRQAGVDPELCRTGHQEGQWNLKRGDLEIWVDVWPVEEEGRTYFQVMTPLVYIPDENREAFYRELLDLDYQMINAALVTYKNGVYVKVTKDTETLTPEEVGILLNRIAFYGETFFEGFIKKFGVKKLEHHE